MYLALDLNPKQISNRNFSPNFLMKVEKSSQNFKKSTMKMEHNILVNLLTVSMEEVSISSQIRMFLWAIGKMIAFMERDFIHIPMDNNIKANSNKAKNVDEESISIRVEPSTMDSGKEIRKMASESLHMLIMRSMKGIG